MKRGLLSIGAALTLVVAALPTSADAQGPQGGPGGRGGGGGGGGGAPSVRSGPQGGGGGGQGYVARSGGAPQGGGQTYIHRGRSPQGGGQALAQGGGGNWHGNGNQHHRRHFRGGPVFGFAAPYPYYYDYASPNYYYSEDDSCYEVRYIRGAYRRVWVCEE